VPTSIGMQAKAPTIPRDSMLSAWIRRLSGRRFRVVQRDYVTQLGFPSEILANTVDDAAPRI
jgi:hypothetical protein